MQSKFIVTQFILQDVKKNIEQVRLYYGLFSQIVNINIEVLLVVKKSSQAKQKQSN